MHKSVAGQRAGSSPAQSEHLSEHQEARQSDKDTKAPSSQGGKGPAHDGAIKNLAGTDVYIPVELLQREGALGFHAGNEIDSNSVRDHASVCVPGTVGGFPEPDPGTQ